MKQLKYQIIIGIAAILLTLQPAHAQSVAKIGYFMDNAPYNHLLNPALVPARGYFSYPVIGSTVIELQSNLGFTNFIFPDPNGGPLLTFMHPSVTPDQFLSQLQDNNYIGINNRLSLLAFGFFVKQSFWNFEIATRATTHMNIPKPFFEFFKNGMSAEDGDVYDIKDLSFTAGMLGEASLGSSYEIIDGLRVGVKGKFLAGGARAKVGIDRLLIDMRQDQWTVESQAELNIHAAGLEFDSNTENPLEDFQYVKPGLAGMGFAADLGVNYAVLHSPLLTVNISAAVLDIGRIKWKKEFNHVARAQGRVEYAGLEDFNFGGMEEGDDPFAALQEQMMDMIQPEFVDENDDYVEKLSPTINVGIEAGTWENRLSAGLLYSNHFMPNKNIAELTGMVNFKPIPMFNVSGSYSLLGGVAQSFGVGVGLNLFLANIFLACDYVPTRFNPQYIPLTKANTNVQLGLSFGFGRKKPKSDFERGLSFYHLDNLSFMSRQKVEEVNEKVHEEVDRMEHNELETTTDNNDKIDELEADKEDIEITEENGEILEAVEGDEIEAAEEDGVILEAVETVEGDEIDAVEEDDEAIELIDEGDDGAIELIQEEDDAVEGNRAATEVGEDKEIDAVDSAEENNADQTEIEESEPAPVSPDYTPDPIE